MTVLKPADASRGDFTKTIIIRLNDKSLPQSLQALKLIADKAEVVEALPDGERASQADFLVIVGSDFKD